MLSIIIPVLNQADMTAECINAIRENTQDCEIIIIDNGSDPAFKAPFTGDIGMTVIRNDENKGFPAAVNQGIKAAWGEIIVLMNNDVVVTPGWAEKLVSALSEFSIVGPVTNYAAGLQRVQAEPYESIPELYKAAQFWTESIGDIPPREVNFIIGFCMMFGKSLFDEIGPFDESLWPCSGEEVDFCFRAREKGHRIGIVEGCYVHHEGSQTFSDLEAAGAVKYAEICKRNDDHLAEKWGADYWSRQEINSSPVPKGLCLNLGCGYRKLEGFINIDNREVVGPDLLCEVVGGLPYPDSSVDMVRADDFLEHIPIGSVIGVMEEIWRVLKPGGVFESSTPSTDGRGAFQDPTHVSFWNRNSWIYYSNPEYRNLYGIKADFEIVSIEDTEANRMIIHTHVVARARK
ncbi:MAG: glycosyltransferase [Syntrophales bacterium]|jgi:GT2 family glycosyltransferase|nr:glycosyltransferase [Syntrophales bacterium]